jgi:Phosphotransferase enzyme family
MSTADARPGNTPGGAPDDAALPGAALLQQPRRFVAVLSSGVCNALLREWLDPGARLVDSRVAIRRYVPGKRCLFELELLIARGGAAAVETRTVMGKLYAGDEGAQVYDTLCRLWASGFSTGPLTVPRPLAYEPDWRLLLLGQARGVLFQQLLLAYQATGDRRQATDRLEAPDACRLTPVAWTVEVCTAVERAAAWLVKLHTSGVTGRRWYTFDRHLHTLGVWQGHLVEVYPEAMSPLAAVLGRIEARGRALSGWEPAPTHRDFSPDNLIVDGTQLSAVDFDEFCQYDPLFDVAHLVAHLRLLGLTSSATPAQQGRTDTLAHPSGRVMVQRFDELAKRFQMAYEARAQEYCAARVRLYEAITYVKLAHIIACVTRPRGWQQTGALLLREAQRTV